MEIMPVGRRCVAFAMALSSAGCSNILSSEAGLPAPTDPGTIVVTVRDSGNHPIAHVEVQVHDIPNTVGTTFRIGQWTNTRGLVEFTYIPAGPRRVEVKLSPGFRAAADSLVRSIDVVKGSAVSVAFVLDPF
jgi:hypothetical protein